MARQYNKVHMHHFTVNSSSMCVSEGKSLKDEDVLQHLPVGTTATFYFRDLGAQISWVTVSTTESCTGRCPSQLTGSLPCRTIDTLNSEKWALCFNTGFFLLSLS